MDNDKTDTPSLADIRWQALEAYRTARGEHDGLVVKAIEAEAEAAVADARAIEAAEALDEAAKTMAEAGEVYRHALAADVRRDLETRGY